MSQPELADALERTASVFRADAHKARVTLRSDSTLQAGFHSQARLRSHQIDIDEPKGIGGTDLGASPVELVLAALGSCQEITYRAFATALGIPLDGVAVSVEGDIDFRGFFAIDETVRPGFSALRVTVNLTTSASQAQVDTLVAAVNRHCPVLDMLSTPVPSHFETRVQAP
jgi:putative redox protein